MQFERKFGNAVRVDVVNVFDKTLDGVLLCLMMSDLLHNSVMYVCRQSLAEG